jgi:class 3 adenylate cyclase
MEHRTIVVVDVADFTNPDRNVADLVAVQEGLYDVLNTAFTESGVDVGTWKLEDRGDGALILLPVEVSKNQLADRLPDRLVAALRRYNWTRASAARFKLRVSIHAGDVQQNAHGWIGHPLNLAFRILEAAEVKSALKQSGKLVALVVSDYFYSEVISQDPGTAPESYRQIPVSVKTFSGNAWLRVPGDILVVREPSPVRPAAIPVEDVLDIVPADELGELQGLLADIQVPQQTTLVSRAVGPAIPPPPWGSAWDVFSYLSDFNAGPDGVPPALAFLALLASEIGGDLEAGVSRWLDQQARRLRLVPVLERRRADRTPIPREPHLHLMVVLEPDAIDPSRCVLSFWRQDDPQVWPPTRGDVREVNLDELEYRVDEIVIDAERVWAGQAMTVVLEFVAARNMLEIPVQRWRKEHQSGEPRPLTFDYQLCLRSLERMRNTHWHRAWHVRWEAMVHSLDSKNVYPFGSTTPEEHPIDAVLSDPRWVGLVMKRPPSPQPEHDAGPDALIAALRAGLPLIFWHPTAGPEDLRELVNWLLSGDGGYIDVLGRHRTSHFSAALPGNDGLVQDLMVMWDDPNRVITLD